MAVITDYRHFVYKTATNKNDSALKHTFWKTNFNVPVEDIYESTTWTRYEGPVNRTGSGTSFSLTGFSPGFEINVFDALHDWENTGGSPESIDVTMSQKWVDTDDSTVLGEQSVGVSFSLGAGNWQEYVLGFHIGVAGWEVDAAGDYFVKSESTGSDPITEKTTTITYSNVPSTTQLGTDKPGHIWVEGNDLAFVTADRWKHVMVGTFVNTTPGTSKKGHLWIDGSDLHWVGDNGSDYKAAWNVKQFASTFGNSATGEENAGTGKYGIIWVDDEYGLTHLAYIASDGYKYITGAGDDPYT